MQKSDDHPLGKQDIPGLVRKINTGITVPDTIPRDDVLNLLSCIDLTTLSILDTGEKVRTLCEKVNQLPEVFSIEANVAGICVYPVFIQAVKETLKDPRVRIVSVSGGFPAGQAPVSVKIKETEYAIENGAREIDIVIPVGKIIQGRENEVIGEIAAIKNVCGSGITLKVILESGIYDDPGLLQSACYCALEGGADFLKTSTGKLEPAAREPDVAMMCQMVQAFVNTGGKPCGIKAAGGISTPESAYRYREIVRMFLGSAWTEPERFRIGASRLANNILSLINPGKGHGYF